MNTTRPLALLVEDDAIQAGIMASMLRRVGFEVTVANNGVDALEAQAANTFDFMLIDLGLPDTPGVELIRSYRASESVDRVEVLAYTASTDVLYHQQARDAGADDVVIKTTDTSNIMTKLSSTHYRVHVRKTLERRLNMQETNYTKLVTAVEDLTSAVSALKGQIEPIHAAYIASQEASRTFARIEAFVHRFRWALIGVLNATIAFTLWVKTGHWNPLDK